jgi:prepilin-type processing-associated H-X9-DG protein
MNPLNNEQKELLFDYCIGITSQKETDEAEALISSNQEAAEIHQKLKAAIEPLSSLEPEACPDELVEKTIYRVQNHADSSQQQLSHLLASEQDKKVTMKIGPWRNWFETAAIAAAILFIAGVLIPTLSSARQKYQRHRCQTQMGSVFQGLSNYISDYDSKAPAVATMAGAPWWKLGDQGRENQSNTRKVYLLPKGGYVEFESFVCPCCKQKKEEEITPSQIKENKDFPDRTYITYSFQINCRKTASGKLLCRKVVMADMNPLFENLPDFSKQFRLQLNRTLLTLNSRNHNRRGQNVLFGDGHIKFLKTRFIDISEDDIYTLQDTDIYQGCEVPSCETDFFLAP